MPEHKHLLIRAEVNKPIKEEKILKKWLKDLVKKIDMKIIKGPYTAYVNKEGNKGITGIVAIETSHVAENLAPLAFRAQTCAKTQRQKTQKNSLGRT